MPCHRAKKKELHGFHGKGYIDSSYSILQMQAKDLLIEIWDVSLS